MPNRALTRRSHRFTLLMIFVLSLSFSGFVVAAESDPIPTPQATDAKEGNSGDPDVPSFVKQKINKEDYFRMRGEQIRTLMGLDERFAKGGDLREEAIREMNSRIGRLGATDPWIALGPNPIPNGQTTDIEVPVSGRISAIDVHPTNPDIVYIGAAQGGVYRSLDGGATWVPLMDSALSLAIGSIAISPSDPTTVWVGTGEASLSADGFFGVGVYRIRNAETTANVEGPFNISATTGLDVMTGNSISKILVHPTDANIIFVGTSSGLGGNGGGGLPTAATPSRGFFRSNNADGAAPTFTKFQIGLADNRRLLDMVMEPGEPNNLVLAIYGNGVANDGGTWRTTDALAASPTFTHTSILALERVEFAIQKTGTTVTVLSASGENIAASTAPCTHASGTVEGVLRRSVDGGVTWGSRISGANGFCNGQCFYDIAVAMPPNDPNIILLGGASNSSSSNPCRASVYIRSTNGTSFSRSDVGLHADVHAMVVSPSNPTVVYQGNDGGVWRSNDSGATWTSLNNSTLFGTQFQSLAVHPVHPRFTIGGTQDNGTEMIKSDGTWFQADYGDGGNSAIDSNSADTETPLMYHTYYNQQNALIGFARQDVTANAVKGGWAFLGVGGTANGIVASDATLFYAPITLGPGNPNTVYFGTSRLYRSSNRGTTMTAVSQNPIFTGEVISTIAVAKLDDNVRIVGTNNGKIFATTTGANPLINITNAGMPVRYVGRVAIDPNNANIAYAAFSGFGVPAGQHIWKNSNLAGGAANWTAIGDDMPDVPVNAFVVDPLNSNHLYAGTDIGVWASTDGGTTWDPYGTDLPRVSVFDMAIQSQSRKLRIATHGKGMYENSIPGAVSLTKVLIRRTVTVTEGVGDGDSVVEPGETAYLNVDAFNEGNGTADGISATVSTTSPLATVTVPTASYADIASAATGTNTTPFEVLISPLAACGQKIPLTITFSYNDATSPRSWVYNLETGSAINAPTNVPYAGAPVTLADRVGTTTGTTIVPMTLSGFSSRIADLNFKIGGSSCNATADSPTVGLAHTWVGDLQIALQSPLGTAVFLTVNNGAEGINFCNTVFDDAAAASITSITPGMAPFTGTFRPAQGALSAFNGENANGLWRVYVFDTGTGDTGVLRDFSIEITEAACSPQLSSVVANTGGTAGGNNVTLNGSGFVSGATVTFDGTPATNVTFVNATQLTATTPPHSPGAVAVVVTNEPAPTATSLAAGFTYVAPVAVANSYSTPEEVTLEVAAPGVLANDTALSGTLSANLVDDVSNGTLSFNPNGSFIYVPNPNFSGVDTFTYTVSDGTATSGPATVTITVNGFNDIPVANDDPGYTTNHTTTLNVAAPGVVANDTDSDGDTLTVQLVTNPTSGTLTLNTDGSFSYVPAAVGTFTFRYRLFDGFITSNIATATITVSADTPTVTSMNPNNGPFGGGTSVTITGTNFVPGATVMLGTVGPVATTFNSSTSLTFVTPAVASAGTIHDLVVKNSATATATLSRGWLADFSDVPPMPGGNIFHDFIESIARYGLTAGCGGGKFCPDDIIPNEQMAVFLLRAQFGNTYIAPGGRPPFDDVPSGPFKIWAEELRFLGFTNGCGGNNFCPLAPVTRASMAPLLLKTKEGAAYVPSTPYEGLFTDVPESHPQALFIEEMKRRGITAGCNPAGTAYCPNNSLTRGQMSVFLQVNFNLP